jgi:hypothetical protein
MKSEEQKCRVCGCTDNNACIGGCHWIAYDLCSACHTPVQKEKCVTDPEFRKQYENRIPQTSSGHSAHFEHNPHDLGTLAVEDYEIKNASTSSSESWGETFEKHFKGVCVLDPDGGAFDHSVITVYPAILSFIKNTITAEVERGRKKTVEECVNVIYGLQKPEDEDGEGKEWNAAIKCAHDNVRSFTH